MQYQATFSPERDPDVAIVDGDFDDQVTADFADGASQAGLGLALD